MNVFQLPQSIKNCIAALLIGIFALAPLSAEFAPQRAEAQTGCAAASVASRVGSWLQSNGLGFIANALGLGGIVGGGEVPVKDQTVRSNTTFDLFIQCVLNPLAWAAAAHVRRRWARV